MREEIKKLLFNKNKKSWVSMIKRRAEMHDWVLNEYPTLQLNESLFLIVNEISPPLAPCGDKRKFENGQYTPYCNLPTRPSSNGDGYCIECNRAWKLTKGTKTKSNNLEKYGVEHSWQREDVKDKVKSTNLERYGVEHSSQIEGISERKRTTYNERYGVDNPMHSTEIKNKLKSTMMEKYGVENAGSLPEVVRKRESTMIERYGVENAMKSIEIKKKSLDTLAVTRFNTIKNKLDKSISILFNESYCLNKNNEDLYPFHCGNCDNDFESSFKYQIRCTHCNPINISTFQNCVINYVRTLTTEEILINTRDVIKPYELDIYIPSLKVAIECNGIYWHNTSIIDKEYHQMKSIMCKEKNIRLIHIFDDEWNDNTDLIKNRLKSVLSTDNKIYARNTEIRVLQNTETEEFLNEHHIQKSCKSSIKLGLYSNNELYAVMTFGKSRFNKNYEWELIRFCSKGTVVGGASKLLKYFEKNYNPKSLISYADMNWSTGNLYQKIGFSYQGMTKPGYFYFNPNTKVRVARQKCTKKILVAEGYDSSLTEEHICTVLKKYLKIYDSGNLIYHKYYQ